MNTSTLQAEMDALTLDKYLAGIDVVGMPRERAWQIALNSAENTPPTKRKTITLERAERVASHINSGYTRNETCERLNLKKPQFDHLRQIAKRQGLI